MTKALHKINYLFLAAVIVFIPLQSLVVELLQKFTTLSSGAVFWFAHWYEPCLVLLLIFAVGLWVFGRKKTVKDIAPVIILLILLGILSVVLISPTIGRGLQGFRFTLLPILFLLLALHQDWKTSESASLIKAYGLIALIAASVAIVEQFLPLNYWEKWGLVSAASTFGFGHFWIVKVYQSASMIGAPNQLATYLLPALFLSLPHLFTDQKKSHRTKAGVIFFIILFAILLTFSRSAFVGLVVGMVAFLLISRQRLITFALAGGVFLLILLSALGIFAARGQSLPDLYTHGASQAEHSEAMSSSIKEIKSRASRPLTLLFGAGLGTAGPLTMKYGDGLVSESWYLQLILEIGVVGLLLWLGLAARLVCDNLVSGAGKMSEGFPLAIGFIAVSVAAIFLHTFADNPAVSLTLFILLGLGYNQTSFGPNRSSELL